MGEIAADQNDTNRWKGAVQNVQPVAEVPVEPHSGNGADESTKQNHGLLGKPENIRKPKTGGVEGIVIGGPDIQAKNQDGYIEEVEVEHHLKDVVTSHIDAGDGSEEEHQGVADEESYDRHDHAD